MITIADEDARLQSMISALNTAENELAELATDDLRLLNEAVAKHDEAAQRQDQLERERHDAQSGHDRWSALAQLRGKVSRHRGWLAIGVLLTLIGLALGPLLLFGLLILAVMGVLYGLGVYAEQQQNTQDRELQRINGELGRAG